MKRLIRRLWYAAKVGALTEAVLLIILHWANKKLTENKRRNLEKAYEMSFEEAVKENRLLMNQDVEWKDYHLVKKEDGEQ